MRKGAKILLAIVACLAIFFGTIATSCTKITIKEGSILRLHIRANSNDPQDQEVKLKVRDKISTYLEQELKDQTTMSNAIKKLNTLTPTLKQIADCELTQNNQPYTSKIKISNEFFPTRMYQNAIVQSGHYDSLTITLGKGEGNNWWCVIYPPLCYVEAQYNNDFKYKSKIKELIKKYFG